MSKNALELNKRWSGVSEIADQTEKAADSQPQVDRSIRKKTSQHEDN